MLDIMCDLFMILCSFFALYFGIISAFCILGKKEENEAKEELKFAILIAARNEEKCIANSIKSLKQQEYPSKLLDIYVIPNNCTDNTKQVSQNAGAKIIEVPSDVNNKGKALRFAMDKLENYYDAFIVFDADNEINRDFVKSINKTLGNGYRVVKSRIVAKNRKNSPIATCYDIHFCTANQFLNRARVRLGLSARIIGTGFAVKTDFLKEIGGFNTETITEDAEIFAICATNGEQVGFCEEAIAYDEQPLNFKISLIQRKRWISGIMQVLIYKKEDFKRGLLNRKSIAYTLDALLQFTFCYIQAIIPFVILFLFLNSQNIFLFNITLLLIKNYISIIMLAILVLALEKRLEFSKNIILGIILYPIFVFSFIPLSTISLFKKTTQWKEIKHTGVSYQVVR